ncbi:MAG: hypothetical protein ACXQS8_03865 [Candidatus Helarchaeales archaeon]
MVQKKEIARTENHKMETQARKRGRTEMHTLRDECTDFPYLPGGK